MSYYQTCAIPKFSTHSQVEKVEKRQARTRGELNAKAMVRNRDRRCRYPGCREQAKGYRLEVAHLVHKGAGGDPALVRTQRHRMILLCHPHHQGQRSFDSGDIRIEPETSQGTDGVCKFSRLTEAGWKVVGVN